MVTGKPSQFDFQVASEGTVLIADRRWGGSSFGQSEIWDLAKATPRESLATSQVHDVLLDDA
jgi:hypothetical protein